MDDSARMTSTATDALEPWRERLRNTGMADHEIAAAEAALREEFARALEQDRSSAAGSSGQGRPGTFRAMLITAVAAAVTIKLPSLFGTTLDGPGAEFYLLNIGVLVLPFLAALFVWIKSPPAKLTVSVGAAALLATLGVNLFPFSSGGSTQVLTAIHLPVALWLAGGVLYAAGRWRDTDARMQFTRFTGEWFITYVLVALGGAVLSALTIGVFEAIGVSVETFVSEWLIPCGAVAAVVVAAWLVESRKTLVAGLAPMLARVFTPLFATMLAVSVVAVIQTRGFVSVEREVLIVFDLLLAVVVALVLYAVSARDKDAGPGILDRIQLALVGSALFVDAYALVSIVARLAQYGLSPNKLAALGLNVILLANLAGAAVLLLGFLRGRRSVAEVERWQMGFLPVYAVWAAVVALVFPLAFAFA